MAKLLRGADTARVLTERLKGEAAALSARGVVPTLAILRVGEREDDLSYERGAMKRCEQIGIAVRRFLLPSGITQEKLLETVDSINADPEIDGCLIFRPLPGHLDDGQVRARLLPTKDVDGITYCFDSYGIMYPGWVKMSSTVPEIKGYRYFYQPETERDKKYIPGEKVESAWLKLEGPPDASGSGQKEWYYFDNTGKPVCGGEDSYEIKKIGDGYYIFDMFGAAQYGLVEVKGDFYYCGAEDGDRKCAVGKAMVDDGVSATRSQYYFDIKGKGITGIKDGYAYYKGKMQKADKAARYEVFDIPGEGKCLVNASGKVMKNTKVTDGNGQKWETGAGGSIKVYGSDEVAELEVPEATVSY